MILYVLCQGSTCRVLPGNLPPWYSLWLFQKMVQRGYLPSGS
ncbi:hypothetical protein RintRC_5859 [Richelia intracellularis]|nr:hypothetical protein RintRC_5859 [Richelia intracellularis]